jgi:hypothetical protein
MVKTTENYWKEVKEVLGDNYENFDFSNADYRGTTKPIKYLCKKHNKWVEKKTAREILQNSYGCETCVTEKRKKTKIEKSKKNFFEEAPKIHNNYYNYDKVVFVDMTTYVIITCPIHGDFLQKPIKHINGKQGCNKCGEERTADGQRMGKDEFIRRCIEKRGDEHYGYHLVNYINCDTNVEIFCNVCEKSFQQTPYRHLSGSGCLDCGIIKRATLMKRIASEKFWEVANNDKRFDFSKYVYDKAIVKSVIKCNRCNEEFLSTPNNYLCGKGCPICCLKTKKKFNEILKQKYSNLKMELHVDWCRNPKKCNEKHNYFPYDFYLCIEDGDIKIHIIIELDGIQHIKPQKFFDRKLTFEERHERDVYKEKCANDNGYHTIRILQEDVLYDKNDWVNNLLREINYIKNNQGNIHHRYICDNNEYDIFM